MLDIFRFEDEVARLEQIAVTDEPSIVFYGSSTFTFWAVDDIKRLLGKENIVNLGFGGSTAIEAFHYCERLLYKHNAAAVCYYEGDNDSVMGLSPEESFRYTKLTLDRLDVPIFIISTKFSPARAQFAHFTEEYNKLCQAYCETKSNLHFVDINEFICANGKIDQTLFLEDNLHLNAKGYQKLAQQLKNEMQF